MPPHDLTPEIQETLLGIRKHSFGKLNQKRTTDVIELLDGWSVEKVNTFLQSDSSDRLKESLGNRDLLIASIYAPDGEERGLKLWCLVYDTKEIAQVLQTEIAAFQIPPDLDNKNITFSVANISPVRPVGERSFGFSFDLFARVKALRITAPTGESFDITTDRAIGPGSRHGYSHFVEWALEHTSLEAQVCDLLGMAPHVRADQRPRDDFDIGTCRVWVKQFKLKSEDGDAIVNHGFQRPGNGYLVGKCFGVGYQPYELSSQACADYIPVIENLRQNRERSLIQLETYEGEERVSDRKAEKGYVVLTPADAKFKRVRESHIKSVKAEIRDMTAFQQELERRVRDWVPEPEKIRRPGEPPLRGVPALRMPKGLGGR